MSGLESATVRGRPTPVRGALRVVRGVVLSVTSAALAIAAHTIGGGTAPDPGLTLLLTVGMAAVGVALAGRRRGFGVILPVLGAAQLATHELLGLTDGMSASMVDPLMMTAAHAVAVVLTALLLAHADAVIFRAAAALSRLLPVSWTDPRVADRVSVPRCADSPARPLAVLLALTSPRRGPPVCA